MPARALRLGRAAPQRRRGDALVVLAVAAEHLADLEQRDVAEAAPRVAFGRGDEAGNEARAHVGKVGGDRVGQRQPAPPPNSSAAGLEMNDQVTASRRPSAASARLAGRVRFCSSVSTGAGTPVRARQRRRGTRSRPAMRTISSTRSALPSMSGRQVGTIAWPSVELEAEPLEDCLAFGLRDVEAGQPLDFAVGKIDRALRRRRDRRRR